MNDFKNDMYIHFCEFEKKKSFFHAPQTLKWILWHFVEGSIKVIKLNFELSFVSKSSSQWNCKLYIGIEFMFVHFSISFFFFRLATTTTTTTATANKRIWLFGKLNTLKSKLFILKKYKKKRFKFQKRLRFLQSKWKDWKFTLA